MLYFLFIDILSPNYFFVSFSHLSPPLSDSSEEVILWNPETSVKPHALETDQVAEQAGHCSGHPGKLLTSAYPYPLE